MRRYIYLLLVLLLGANAVMQAQVVLNFAPAINGLRLDGLYFVQVMNSSGSVQTGKLKIIVRSSEGNELVSITTGRLVVKPGMNQLNKNAFAASAVRFGSGYAANVLQQTGKFPEGTFEYCFEFLPEGIKVNDDNYLNCFEHTIQPLTPLSLIYPADGDEICITRPAFMWQPPLPVLPQTKFRLVLVESKNGDGEELSLSNNIPFINQAGLMGNTILYPANVPDLVQGRQYAWQVIAYAGNTVLSKSEIWTFTIRCDSPKVVTDNDSYRELKEVGEGNYYMVNNMLRFSFMNPYGEGNLNYSIIDLDEPKNNLGKMPKVKIRPGLNRVDLDVSDMDVKRGHQYLLRVKRSDNRTIVLRFLLAEQ